VIGPQHIGRVTVTLMLALLLLAVIAGNLKATELPYCPDLNEQHTTAIKIPGAKLRQALWVPCHWLNREDHA